MGRIEMTKTHCAACCNNYKRRSERNASHRICTNRKLVLVAYLQCRCFGRRFLIGLLKSFLLYLIKLHRVHWQTLSVNHTDRCKEREKLQYYKKKCKQQVALAIRHRHYVIFLSIELIRFFSNFARYTTTAKR